MLETLTTDGLVEHVHLAHGATAYHLAETAHPRAHCTTCGAAFDIPPDLLDAPSEVSSKFNGFVLDPTHVALAGTCSTCAQVASEDLSEPRPSPRQSG